MRGFVLAGLVGITVLAGCHDTTAPRSSGGRTATITGIQLPARAAPSDTISISFTYVTGACDTTAVSVRQTASGVHFTAMAFPTNRFCLAVISSTSVYRYLVFPVHDVPFEAVFTEPSGGDSIRVVAQ